MSGLNAEQLDELEECVEELLEEPWDKGKGRPRELTFREALIVACGYARNNITEEVWAEIFDVGQSTISRYITFLTPLIDQATAGFRPPAGEAAEATRGAIALVDGTLWPCWSWEGKRELWSGKYKTTGHGSLIITNLAGRITFVSEPVTGNRHDMAKLKRSECETILKGSYSASVTVLWVFAARVNITEYVAQARPCPCCGTVTEGSYATCAGAGQLRPETFGQAREPDGRGPDFGPAGSAAAAPVPRHRRLDGMDGRDPREDRRGGVAASGFMERAGEPLKTASAVHADEPRTAVGIRPRPFSLWSGGRG